MPDVALKIFVRKEYTYLILLVFCLQPIFHFWFFKPLAMSKKINSDFQWLLHLAVLRTVIRDHPQDYTRYLSDIGRDIGNRLADDFCARFSIYGKIQNKDVERYLKIFLEFYFGNDLVTGNCEVRTSSSILKHQGVPGAVMFKEIFQEVFDSLNGNVVFADSNDKILFTFKEDQDAKNH
ncbi:uncharacterized protein VICG_01900 [Vittaforma corneae ATCC 50505]|uniref:Uncharacterized protein n=1 Tax=Vittaforma corneae (strain ATCC 50505) TaxID=993615 RepID=L2GLF8_VITCO|nr:uncharacterized protein VICG_01900 [Vittaforma corneae ATCC 50505]ELA41107.1 hypothetical protein VICG_01900 [Vittaforma corneae ATCC 50505]